ncbi:MAG: hypothetical protein DRJ52_04385 [Thermoprotei archaeon]|nr:MAG: hypothetical protein DRJ52_04385 [Thermoprotei archaeon]
MKKLSFKLPTLKDKKKEAEKERREKILPKIRFKLWDYDVNMLKVIDEYSIGYSRIVIGKDTRLPEIKYVVVDPKIPLDILVKHERIVDDLIYKLTGDESEEELEDILREQGVDSPELIYIIKREIKGYGPLDPLVNDPSLENIECNGANKPLTVTHTDYGRLETNLIFNEEELDRLVLRLAHMAGKSVSRANPKLDGVMLPGGHRYTCTFASEVSPTSTFVIRKFPKKAWTITRIMSKGTLTPELAAWLWLLVENKLPILIAGEMGSGKTSLANALCSFIPPDRRIGTAEDIPEFKIPHKYWTRRFTREAFTYEGKGEISLFDLLKHLLRANVDYVIINEIRGEEAKVWFQAITVGHGGITTIHADSPRSVLFRLKELGVDPSMLLSLYEIVFIAPFTMERDGMKIKIRRVREVVDLDFKESGEVDFVEISTYDIKSDRIIVNTDNMFSSRAAKTIMKFRGWSLDELKKEYSLRVEFLQWLYKQSIVNPLLLESEKLWEVMVYFYSNPLFFKEIPVDERVVERIKERRRVKRRVEEEKVVYKQPRVVTIRDVRVKTPPPRVVKVSKPSLINVSSGRKKSRKKKRGLFGWRR